MTTPEAITSQNIREAIRARISSRVGDGWIEAAYNLGATEGAAAERDRIRQLAEQQSRAPISAQSPIASQALREFADLLREVP